MSESNLPIPDMSPNVDLMALSDQELNLRAQAGDDIAFALLYNRHAGTAARTASPYVDHIPYASPEDVGQEVAIRMWNGIRGKKPPVFGDESGAEPWTRTVARNAGLDAVRWYRSRAADSLDEITEALPQGVDPKVAASVGSISLESEFVSNALVAELLDQLDPEARTMVELRVLQRYEYTEIADMLGVPLGTVKSRINRANKKMREYLEAARKSEEDVA